MPLTISLRKKDSRPQKVIQGTSYKASGAVPVPSNAYAEQGSSRSQGIRDPVPELGSLNQQVQTYAKMARTDASVKVSLRAGKTPVLGGDYFIEAYDETEEAEIIREFADTNIFHCYNSPFLLVLQAICKNMELGSTVFEPVYEPREWAPKKVSRTANRRQYTMLRKLGYRPRLSITEFLYDNNGGPEGVKHRAVRADRTIDEIEIPIEKLIIFPFEGDPGNLEGESILRSAYPHWYYKETLYKIDAIQKERHGVGVPDIELQPGFNDADKLAAHELGRNLRSNERGYIVRPANLKVGFAELHGNTVDVLESANHHDNMIMKNVMVQFLNLGIEGAGGGRATGATAADMFMKSMRYVGNVICEYFNKFLIPNLIAYNFPTDQYPQMKVRNIGEVKDIQMWAAAMAQLVDKNIITMDDESEQFVREIIDWPKKREPRPPSTMGASNVRLQYLLRDNPDTLTNEDLAGLASMAKNELDKRGNGGGPSGPGNTPESGPGAAGGERTGNINKGTTSGI